MRLTAKALPARLPKTPLLVLFAAEDGAAAPPGGLRIPSGFLESFKGKARTSAVTATDGPAERVLVVGVGPRAEVDAEGLRRAAAIAVRRAEALEVAKAVFHLAGLEKLGGRGKEGLTAADRGRALAEGALLGAYRFDELRSKPEKPNLKAVELLGGERAFRAGVTKGKALAAANAFTRDLQNRPGNVTTPRALATAAKKLAAAKPRITCKVLDEKQMAALGMGLLLSVSRGSEEPARLIHLRYKPKGKAKARICLVGKGLTFDAGGISLKPSAKMDEMRYDMSGGAAVLGVFHALTALDVGVEVHGVVPASENLPDGKANKPGDVHRGMDGTTVEIQNTDAEGRLILADALAYAKSKIRPDTIIDLATLTGAVITALGHELTAIYPSDSAIERALVEAGRRTGEAVWPMPLLDVHREAVKGKSADLANISSPSVGAGSVTAAAFLRHFVPEDTQWCHLDIAGTAWGTKERDWVGGGGGTGVGTRLLFEYLEALT